MSKFSKLMENTFQKSNLRKVKLKTDPLYASSEEFSKFQGYEGFVISENDKTIKLYFEGIDGGCIVDIPLPMVDIQSGLSKFEKLKLNVLIYLKETKALAFDNKLIQVIMVCNNINDLVMFLRNNGCTNEDLVNIFKSDYEEV